MMIWRQFFISVERVPQLVPTGAVAFLGLRRLYQRLRTRNGGFLCGAFYKGSPGRFYVS